MSPAPLKGLDALLASQGVARSGGTIILFSINFEPQVNPHTYPGLIAAPLVCMWKFTFPTLHKFLQYTNESFRCV